MTLLPSPSSQQNHKRKANSPFPCSKAKKVAVALVFFFNTKLQPSLLCYKGKKKDKTTKEEGDDNCRCLLREAALSERSSTTESPSSIALQREEGDGNCRRLLRGAALQRSSTPCRRRRGHLLRGAVL